MITRRKFLKHLGVVPVISTAIIKPKTNSLLDNYKVDPRLTDNESWFLETPVTFGLARIKPAR